MSSSVRILREPADNLTNEDYRQIFTLASKYPNHITATMPHHVYCEYTHELLPKLNDETLDLIMQYIEHKNEISAGVIQLLAMSYPQRLLGTKFLKTQREKIVFALCHCSAPMNEKYRQLIQSINFAEHEKVQSLGKITPGSVTEFMAKYLSTVGRIDLTSQCLHYASYICGKNAGKGPFGKEAFDEAFPYTNMTLKEFVANILAPEAERVRKDPHIQKFEQGVIRVDVSDFCKYYPALL